MPKDSQRSSEPSTRRRPRSLSSVEKESSSSSVPSTRSPGVGVRRSGGSPSDVLSESETSDDSVRNFTDDSKAGQYDLVRESVAGESSKKKGKAPQRYRTPLRRPSLELAYVDSSGDVLSIEELVAYHTEWSNNFERQIRHDDELTEQLREACEVISKRVSPKGKSDQAGQSGHEKEVKEVTQQMKQTVREYNGQREDIRKGYPARQAKLEQLHQQLAVLHSVRQSVEQTKGELSQIEIELDEDLDIARETLYSPDHGYRASIKKAKLLCPSLEEHYIDTCWERLGNEGHEFGREELEEAIQRVRGRGQIRDAVRITDHDVQVIADALYSRGEYGSYSEPDSGSDSGSDSESDAESDMKAEAGSEPEGSEQKTASEPEPESSEDSDSLPDT